MPGEAAPPPPLGAEPGSAAPPGRPGNAAASPGPGAGRQAAPPDGRAAGRAPEAQEQARPGRDQWGSARATSLQRSCPAPPGSPRAPPRWVQPPSDLERGSPWAPGPALVPPSGAGQDPHCPPARRSAAILSSKGRPPGPPEPQPSLPACTDPPDEQKVQPRVSRVFAEHVCVGFPECVGVFQNLYTQPLIPSATPTLSVPQAMEQRQ